MEYRIERTKDLRVFVVDGNGRRIEEFAYYLEALEFLDILNERNS